MFVRLFRIEVSESFGKSLAGAIYKEEKWRNGDMWSCQGSVLVGRLLKGNEERKGRR